MHTASFRTVRGYTIVAALLDEVAFWAGEESSSPDTEIINAIRPAIIMSRTAMLLCASSPYARRGVLFEAFQRHYGHAGPTLVWRAPTRVISVPQRLVDEAMEADPSAAAAEYLAEFRSDIESFISREAVEACVNQSALEYPPLHRRRYVAFVDPSGGSRRMRLAHREEDVAVLDVLRERRPPSAPRASWPSSPSCSAAIASRGCRATGTPVNGPESNSATAASSTIRAPAQNRTCSEICSRSLTVDASVCSTTGDLSRNLSVLSGAPRGRAETPSTTPPVATTTWRMPLQARFSSHLGKKPRMRIGTIDFASTGRVTWHGEREPLRIRTINVTEQEALRQKAEGSSCVCMIAPNLFWLEGEFSLRERLRDELGVSSHDE